MNEVESLFAALSALAERSRPTKPRGRRGPSATQDQVLAAMETAGRAGCALAKTSTGREVATGAGPGTRRGWWSTRTDCARCVCSKAVPDAGLDDLD